MSKRSNRIDRHVGRRIRMRRLTLHMSQARLGKAVGVTFQQIQKYEDGSNRISAGALQKMAKAMQVPVAFFFEGAPAPLTAPQVSGPDFVVDFVSSDDGLALIQAFGNLEDARLRRRIVDLVERVAALHDGGRR
jgi:transcriptional regulator with XRE-family HTH domain